LKLFLEINSNNPKLKEIILNKLMKNILEIIKSLDEAMNFLKAEINNSEKKIFSIILDKDINLFNNLFKNQIDVILKTMIIK